MTETRSRRGGPSSVAAPGRRRLWVGLSVVGLVVVLVAVVLVASRGSGDGTTADIEQQVPPRLESILSDNGLDVTVTSADCSSVPGDDGLFTTDCEITVDGLAEPLEVTAHGSIDGSTVTIEDVRSGKLLLSTELATEQAQAAVATLDPGFTVLSCELPAPVVFVDDELVFSCALDTGETVAFEVQDGQLVVQAVG